jgi:hypothetical protein
MAKERRPNGDAQMITMQAIATHTLATALARAVAATLAGQLRAGSALVTFQDSDTAGVLYATVDRGNITERLLRCTG